MVWEGSSRKATPYAECAEHVLSLIHIFVIIKYSGFSMAAAFFGFLVCPAAVVLEIVYELVTYEHS